MALKEIVLTDLVDLLDALDSFRLGPVRHLVEETERGPQA